MKAFITTLSITIGLLFFIACGNSTDDSKTTTTQTEQEETINHQEEIEETPAATLTLEEKIEYGENVYTTTCVPCHQADGQGLPNAFPPLAASDYLNEDMNRAIEIVINGISGPITVNGTEYNSVMAKLELSDEEVANVLTYVYNNWDNNQTEVNVSDVAAVRSSL